MRERSFLGRFNSLGRRRQVQRYRSSIPFTGGRPRPVRSSSRPFCVRFNQQLWHYCLIRWLRLSIQGLWLGAALAGFSSRSSANHFQSAGACDCWPRLSSAEPLPRLDAVRAKRPDRLPTVLSGDEVQEFGHVHLPVALAAKYPHASRILGLQYRFPAARLSRDPRDPQAPLRRHLH